MQDVTAPGPHLVRWVNARAVLEVLRRASGVLSVSELMDHTRLTRATVIAVCEDLVQRGWAEEPDVPRGPGPQKGRPARRFAFRADAGAVLGIDLGVAKATVLVADLRGETLAQATSGMPAEAEAQRIDTIAATALRALEACGRSPRDVLAVGAGMAAPVDREGRVVGGQAFWGQFDFGLAEALDERFGWRVLLENDANLAALAEQWRGAARGVEDVAVMLAGERVGAGVLESGRLLRGHGGGFGELAFLSMVDGVGAPAGIAQLAREWGAEAATEGGLGGMPPEEVSAEAVFAAATDGDEAARAVLDRIALVMARVVAILSTVFNPELVVIGGAVADAASRLLPRIRAQLPALTATPARVEVSPLGGRAVTLGAVRRALDDVAARSLEIDLP
ncbi:ROK family protein [Sinomonas mesophila]|uniref:ROK family protein n=1 Tax=Sinomonas mesophila TaxID=1531955 RepID=UPI00098784EE|nr:ROK family protein [Sinomonas mesophila]